MVYTLILCENTLLQHYQEGVKLYFKATVYLPKIHSEKFPLIWLNKYRCLRGCISDLGLLYGKPYSPVKK